MKIKIKILLNTCCVVYMLCSINSLCINAEGTGTTDGLGASQEYVDSNIVKEENIDNDSDKDVSEQENKSKENIEEKEDIIDVTEIDLGDYDSEMQVGDRQLIVVTIIPTNATDSNIIYSSSNSAVARINGLGRITANAVGETTIKAECGGKGNSFTLKVKEKESDEIAPTDIEISDYKDEIKVDDSIILSTKILPTNSTVTEISYSSSNPKIATVNSSGEIKGVSKGEVTITLKAGDVTKSIKLKVVVDTKKIKIANDYLILKPGGKYKIDAKVYPEEGDQEITYKSQDETIATVSLDGTVTAKKNGNTSIILTNGDITSLVTVIVNQNGAGHNLGNNCNEADMQEDVIEANAYGSVVDAEQYKKITKDILKYLYENNKDLIIQGKGYTIKIIGSDIVNFNNPLYTNIPIKKNKDGEYEFEINSGKPLCGQVVVSFDNDSVLNIAEKKLYLFNESKDKYEELEFSGADTINLTKAGKYKLSDGKTQIPKRYIVIAGICGGGILVLLGLYTIFNKRYLFW